MEELKNAVDKIVEKIKTMYLTHSFVAIKKGELDYLFFYLTEDYIEAQIRLQNRLQPILEDFGRNLLNIGALVKAFDKDIINANQEVKDKWKQQEGLSKVVHFQHEKHIPGLLIVNKDFGDFNPESDQWLYISFRDYMDEFGGFKIFELHQLLKTIADICNSDQNLFEEVKEHIRKKEAVDAHKILEIKPGIFGISLDVKEAVNFIKNWNNKYKQA